MNFLSTLLQGISFIPAIVSGIENIFGGRPGTEKKNAAVSFLHCVSHARRCNQALTSLLTCK